MCNKAVRFYCNYFFGFKKKLFLAKKMFTIKLYRFKDEQNRCFSNLFDT